MCLAGALRLEPASSTLWAALGTCAREPALCEYALARSLQLEPKASATWAALGRLYLVSGEPGLADRCLTQARSHEPASVATWEAMGALAGLSPSGALTRQQCCRSQSGHDLGGLRACRTQDYCQGNYQLCSCIDQSRQHTSSDHISACHLRGHGGVCWGALHPVFCCDGGHRRWLYCKWLLPFLKNDALLHRSCCPTQHHGMASLQLQTQTLPWQGRCNLCATHVH